MKKMFKQYNNFAKEEDIAKMYKAGIIAGIQESIKICTDKKVIKKLNKKINDLKITNARKVYKITKQIERICKNKKITRAEKTKYIQDIATIERDKAFAITGTEEDYLLRSIFDNYLNNINYQNIYHKLNQNICF